MAFLPVIATRRCPSKGECVEAEKVRPLRSECLPMALALPLNKGLRQVPGRQFFDQTTSLTETRKGQKWRAETALQYDKRCAYSRRNRRMTGRQLMCIAVEGPVP